MSSEPAWVSKMRAVDWASLEYCYGEATNVSELIETIAFGTAEEARQACSTLGNELEHQASIYSSTYEAIPFLIEAAAVAAPGVGPRVLNLLATIVGSAIHWIEIAESSPDSNKDYWTCKYIERAWLGSDLFARLLQHEGDILLRIVAGHLLGLLLTRGPALAPADEPGRYQAVVAALVERLQGNESDEFALSNVIFAIGRGAVHDRSLLEPLRKARERPGVGAPTQVSVALAVIMIDDGRHAELEEVDLLIDTMRRAEDTDELFHFWGGRARSPWVVGRLRFTLRAVLCAWSAGHLDRMERVLPALLTGVRLANGHTADADLGPVFQWLWPARKPTFTNDGSFKHIWPEPITASDLTDIGRRVIQACYDNPRIWVSKVGNTNLAFRHVGLPEERSGLKLLLGRPRPRLIDPPAP